MLGRLAAFGKNLPCRVLAERFSGKRFPRREFFWRSFRKIVCYLFLINRLWFLKLNGMINANGGSYENL